MALRLSIPVQRAMMIHRPYALMHLMRIGGKTGYNALVQTFATTTVANTQPIQFDTHRVVKRLQEHGFSAEQSEAILEVITVSMSDTLDAQARLLATKSEHVELKAELSERVFNSTLKFDIAQRHMRELLERDFNNLKQDIRMLEKIDFDKIRVEIAELEKKVSPLFDILNL
jgi:phage FluMu protein gp41